MSGFERDRCENSKMRPSTTSTIVKFSKILCPMPPLSSHPWSHRKNHRFWSSQNGGIISITNSSTRLMASQANCEQAIQPEQRERARERERWDEKWAESSRFCCDDKSHKSQNVSLENLWSTFSFFVDTLLPPSLLYPHHREEIWVFSSSFFFSFRSWEGFFAHFLGCFDKSSWADTRRVGGWRRGDIFCIGGWNIFDIFFDSILMLIRRFPWSEWRVDEHKISLFFGPE